MTFAKIFKNDDGTKTAFYSGEKGPRTMAFNMEITTGKIYKATSGDWGYKVEVIGVTKNSIKTRYYYNDGSVWDHSFTPHAFYQWFIYPDTISQEVN